MRVLIVDDWKHRHTLIKEIFDRGFRPALFTSRMSPSDVTKEDLDLAEVVFLDHDMCRAQEDDPCPNLLAADSSGKNMLNAGCGCPTGQDMVRELIAYAENTGKKHKCVVHSANTTGGRVMAQALHDAGFPVAWSPVFTWESLVTPSIFKLWKI